MKKFFLLISIILHSNYFILPQNHLNANAGIIKWGVKKAISGFVKIIFSHAKDRVIEYNKEKLLKYLKKNPQYKEYAKSLIMKQINKYPHLKNRGYEILQRIR